MTFNAYFQGVCPFVVFLCALPCVSLQAGIQQKQLGIHRILLIVDKGNHSPVAGACMSVEGRNFVSSSDGKIVFSGEIPSQGTAIVRSLGYLSQTVYLKDVFEKGRDTIRLVPETMHLEEVVITAKHSGETANTVSGKLSSSAIEHAIDGSLASLLEQVSGVSSISTGTTVAKPVIQGMYGNRILIINNGVRQAGQQWGTDHSPEVDMNSSGTIHVIKGSEGVRYGSEAMGGVIVMEQKPLPFRRKSLKGKVVALYGSNGKRYALTGEAEGAFPFLEDLAWRIQGTYVNSGDRSTANYLLNNTGTRGKHFSATLGYERKRIKVEGFYSRFDNRTGVMFSAQMGSEDLLAERIRLGRPVHTDPFTRHISYPYQWVVHQTATGKIRYDTGNTGIFYWQTSWQNDNRREYRIRRMGHSGIPAVSLCLSSFQHNLYWRLAYGAWQTEIGGQLISVNNHSRSGTGIVPVIPNYTETHAGIYGMQKFYYGKGGFETGIRLDGQETRASGYDWTGSPYGGTRRFGHATYSLGGHFRFSEHWTLTTNFGLSWRAPHVYELYSNGNELGSGMFVKGNASMDAERSHKWISSVSYRNRMFDISLDGYLQWIRGYIYDEPTRENITVISGVYPVFRYRQTSAFFRGMDFDLHFIPSGSWGYHLITSLIRAHERGTGNYLPYIPSFHLGQELAWTHENKSHTTFHLKVRHRFVAKQKRFNPDADLIPYTPAAYHLFGLEADIGWPMKNGCRFRFIVAGDNVLNKEYKEYTNRSRYYAHDMGRDVHCSLSWTF